jgi:2-dehydro-3-deoxygluconokinase
VRRPIARLGVSEVAAKQGTQGCLVSAEGIRRRVPAVLSRAIDTTAAGDAFNAAYLAACIGGTDPAVAAGCGHRLASAVVRHPGAIIPTAATPSLELDTDLMTAQDEIADARRP